MQRLSNPPLPTDVGDFAHRIRNRYESEGMAGIAERAYAKLESLALQRYYLHTTKTRSGADPYAIRWVDPNEIRYVSGRGLERRATGRHVEYVQRPWYHRYAEHGDVLDGNWDARDIPFTEFTEWRLVQERFGSGIPWEETSVYGALRARIEAGRSVWGCSTIDELHERFRYLTDLKESMASQGYRPTTDTVASGGDVDSNDRMEVDGVGVGREGPAFLDEVSVDIGRYGELLFHSNGRHRLALAIVLDIPEIPVLITVRHASWERLRERVSTGSDPGPYTSHPDLVDVIQ